MLFSDLGLSEPILRAVESEGYTTATPIQAQAIPHILKGADLLGSAQTGTGKTAAFALPILHLFSVKPRPEGAATKIRALVLCPTRELASQIGLGIRTYGKNLKFRYAVIFGGMNQGPQVTALRSGVDILVATPGRLMDLMEQGHVDLSGVEVLVLDEADRMLDMGFIHAIRQVVAKLPVNRQTLMFSATMPAEIRKLSATILRKPVTVEVAPVSSTSDRIDQSVYFVDKHNKVALLAHLVDNLPMSRAIVFTRTKHGADKVVRQLHVRGIKAEAIHSNKSQGQRKRALSNFKDNKVGILVATDIASRGIDIDGVTHVVNFDVTHEPETYVHRIGRTARAGSSGAAVSLCDTDERGNLRAIERLIKRQLTVKNDQPAYTGGETFQHKPDHRQDEERSNRREPRQENRPQQRPHGSGNRSPHQNHSAASHAPRHPSRHPAQGGQQQGGGFGGGQGGHNAHGGGQRPKHAAQGGGGYGGGGKGVTRPRNPVQGQGGRPRHAGGKPVAAGARRRPY